MEIHTESGNPADVIVGVADEVGADLIVVGSKGMRGTRRILGSVPNSVAHKAGLPRAGGEDHLTRLAGRRLHSVPRSRRG